LIDSFWPIDAAPTSDAGVENYGIEFRYVRLQEAPIQCSHRKEVCQLNIFGSKVDALGETMGNEGGPIRRQVLLECFKRVTALLRIPRSEYDGQLGGERLLVYEFVYELVADAQSQTTVDGKLARDNAAGRSVLPVGAGDENIGMLRCCSGSGGAHLDVVHIFKNFAAFSPLMLHPRVIFGDRLAAS
jgi:hypothetical protein